MTTSGKLDLLLNNDSGGVDHIASVVLTSSVQSPVLSQVISPLRIAGYSKDSAILSKGEGKCLVSIQGSSIQEYDKLVKYCAYLSERCKAAVIKLRALSSVSQRQDNIVSREAEADPTHEGEDYSEFELYLLPLSKSAGVDKDTGKPICECISKVLLTSASSQSVSNNSQRSSATGNFKVDKDSNLSNVIIKPKESIEVSSSSFLGSLLNKAKATQIARTTPMNPIDLIKKQRLQEIQSFMSGLREKLQSFVEDDNFLEYSFEPMDKERRHIIHEVTDDFPDLLATSVGDEPERAVLVYRKDHRPASLPDNDIVPDKSQIGRFKPQRPSNKKPSESSNIITVSDDNLIKLNPAKRDRRTVADVMEDLKKRKYE